MQRTGLENNEYVSLREREAVTMAKALDRPGDLSKMVSDVQCFKIFQICIMKRNIDIY